MFPISLHKIKADAALNRRTIEDQFQFWAEQLNEFGDYNFALKTVLRESLTLDAAQEMWWNRAKIWTSGLSKVYERPRIVDSELMIETAPGGDFWLDWSVDIKDTVEVGFDETNLRMIPYAAGQLLWRAADKIEHEWPLTVGPWVRVTPIPGDYHSLSGQCHFSSPTGVFEVGLIAACDTRYSDWFISHFDVEHTQIMVRRAH